MSSDNAENIFKAIDERRDELVELTRALIRFPTVNPPGEAYRPCAEFIGERMRTRGFAVDGRSQWSGGAQYRGGGSPRDRP